MVIMIKSAIITFAICYIVDLSGIVQKLNYQVFRMIFGKEMKYNGFMIPVISCSLCLAFWANLIYCIAIMKLDLVYSFGIAALFSYCSTFISLALKKVRCWLSDVLSTDIKVMIEK